MKWVNAQYVIMGKKTTKLKFTNRRKRLIMWDFIKEFKWYIIALVLIVIVCSFPAWHVETHTVEVIKTEIVGNNDHYMIFCKENGKNVTYTLDDSFWHWQWNTSDIYAGIEVGVTYNIRTSGFRIPFLSSYKNIIEIHAAN